MTTSSILAACAVALGCVTLTYISRRYLQNTGPGLPLPPGPPGLPWVGNVIGIDTKAPWLTYREWAKTYGKSLHNERMLSA